MQRLFLSWDKPACHAVADRLLTVEKNIYRHVVLVPTIESGRQLREQLAARSVNQAIFPPLVTPADRFLQDYQEDNAGNIEELAAWVMALSEGGIAAYPTLFPKQLPDDFSCLLDVAVGMQKLRRNMASQGVNCEKAAQTCGTDDERWPDIAKLTARYESRLKGWNLKDTAATMQKGLIPHNLLTQLKESGGSIIVACVPDLTSPVCHALRHAEENGIPVQIWINAPQDEAATFDDMGHPLPEVWNHRLIPLTNAQITVTATPERLAEQTCRLIAEKSADGAPDIALGVCDPDMNVALDAKLRDVGWGLYNPDGRAFAGTGMMDLLRSLAQGAEDEDRAEPLLRLTRSTLLCKSLGIENQQFYCATLDKIRQTYLPEKESYLLACLTREPKYCPVYKAIQPIIEWKKAMLTPGKLGEELKNWLPQTEAAGVGDTDALHVFTTAVNGLVRVQSLCRDFHVPDKALNLLIKSLQHSRIKSRRSGEAALDSLGWMEVHFRPEAHLILTGLNEGMVPEGKVSDQFMPEGLKQRLNINSLDSKKARDSFLLTALHHSREKNGSIHVALSRVSSKNDPLTPSGLLMRCPDEELPKRVELLFSEVTDVPAPLHYERGEWFLQPNGGWQKKDNIETLAPGYVNPWRTGERTFSPNILRKFLDCPLRFWVQQALNLSDKEISPNKDDMDSAELGNMMHKTLEDFCKKYHTATSASLHTMQDDITAMLDMRFHEQYGADALLPLIIQKRSMEARLLKFAELHRQDLNNGWNCIEFEKEVNNWEFNGFRLNFRIDRIDRKNNGEIRIIDYKTGKIKNCSEAHLEKTTSPDMLTMLSPTLAPYVILKAKTKKQEFQRWKNLQLPIYVLWAMQEFGVQPQAGYYALPSSVGDIKYIQWDTLYEPSQEGVSVIESAKNWLTELMTIITKGEGLISAEELGWKVSPYSIIDKLLASSDIESLRDLLNLNN